MSNFYYDKDIELEVISEGTVTRKIKAHDGTLMLVEVVFENGGIGPEHTHVHEQATYCLEGEFEFKIGDEVKTIKTGDTVYIPSNANHGAVLKTPRGRLLDIFTPQREDFLKK